MRKKISRKEKIDIPLIDQAEKTVTTFLTQSINDARNISCDTKQRLRKYTPVVTVKCVI